MIDRKIFYFVLTLIIFCLVLLLLTISPYNDVMTLFSSGTSFFSDYFENDNDLDQMFSPENLFDIYSPDKKLMGPAALCAEEEIAKLHKNTLEYQIRSADCGLDYNVTLRRNVGRWRVALYGPSFDGRILTLSGCPLGDKCPFSPHCEFFRPKTVDEAKVADVLVIFQNDWPLINYFPAKRLNKYKVLYWREAFYKTPTIIAQAKFDFEMGVHWQSGILNPQFLRTPSALLGGITYPHPQIIPFLPAKERTNLAMSIISNCGADSQRQTYINRLVHYLGAKRIHQYGKCGDLELPPPPIKNAAKVIATYKFYLAFENTIEDGYVTEKLLQVLQMPVVPIYYGTPNTPNITKIPSFIKASDFSHPKHLSDYLLHLDVNDEEYYQYHAWRTNKNLFEPSFLKMMAKKSPGVREMERLREKGGTFYPRTAACCRLCDPEYVKWAASERSHFIEDRWTKTRIEKHFFEGKFYGEPK